MRNARAHACWPDRSDEFVAFAGFWETRALPQNVGTANCSRSGPARTVIRSVRSLLALLWEPPSLPITGHRVLCRLAYSGRHVPSDARLRSRSKKRQGSSRRVGRTFTSIQFSCHPRLLDRPPCSRAYFSFSGHWADDWNVGPLWHPSLDRGG